MTIHSFPERACCCRSHAGRYRGFAVADLVAVPVVAVMIAALLVLAGDRNRRQGRLGEDLAKLRLIGAATGHYAADSEERFWSFSWRAGAAPISPSDPNGSGLTFASTHQVAALNQMVYLIRTEGERPNFPPLGGLNLFPYLGYGHLALSGYLPGKLPAQVFVSSEDRHRSRWAADPLGYDMGLYTPTLGIGNPSDMRHPYGAGLRFPTAFIEQSPPGLRVYSAGNTSSIFIPGGPQTVYAGQPLAAVAHPSQKVMLYDTTARHFGPRQPFATHPEARLPLLMVDGGASVRSSADGNPGCNPNNGATFVVTYTPSPIDPPATGANAQPMPAGFIWTRKMLEGRDFGGPEVPGF